MPIGVKGVKRRWTPKEDRQAQHIIDSEEKRGVKEVEARRIAYGVLSNELKKHGGRHLKGK